MRTLASVLLLMISSFALAQNHARQADEAYAGPTSIVRNIIQDRKGNMFVAAFDGVFKYDGKSFTKITSGVSTARFFSVMEDRKGNIWLGSVGGGVFRYDGSSFQHFSTMEGLLNNEILYIYEDRAGRLWFGVNGGVSIYDGKTFSNYLIRGDEMVEARLRETVPDMTRPPNEVNAIVEDKTGKVWLATRGNTYVYNGRTFGVVSTNGMAFKNVRSLIEDRKGNIWLGGADGLWVYNGSTYSSIAKDFVGYIYEDKQGRIWTSSQTGQDWGISRYSAMQYPMKPTGERVISLKEKGNAGMVFGILEASDGSIWFGGLGGVYRFNSTSVSNFR